ADSAKLAAALQAANRTHARYPATIGSDMAGTDSIRFQDLVAAVSVRENERITGIVRGSNPNHHEPTDKYENYAEEDFRFGFNSAQTTLGGLGNLVGIALVRPREKHHLFKSGFQLRTSVMAETLDPSTDWLIRNRPSCETA